MRPVTGLLACCLLALAAHSQVSRPTAGGGLLAELVVGPLPDTLRVGDPFVLTLDARWGEGVGLRWPELDPHRQKPLHILKDLGVDTLGPGHLRRTFEVAVFAAGTLSLAPFEVVIDPGDGEFLLPSDSLRLTVHSVLEQALSRGDSLAPRDILDPAPVPLTWREILPWVLGVLVAGVLGWFAWRTYTRRPVAEPVIPSAPPPDPWARWLRRLEQIRRESRWSRGETVEYYADLSLVLRGLLEDTLDRPFREMTHDEVRHALEDTSLPGDLRRELMHLLLESDMVKYARQWPADARNGEVLADCAAWGERARAHLLRPRVVDPSGEVAP